MVGSNKTGGGGAYKLARLVGGAEGPLLLAAMSTRGSGGMLPQKIFEILGVTRMLSAAF